VAADPLSEEPLEPLELDDVPESLLFEPVPLSPEPSPPDFLPELPPALL
jgi:hypothetical protein